MEFITKCPSVYLTEDYLLIIGPSNRAVDITKSKATFQSSQTLSVSTWNWHLYEIYKIEGRAESTKTQEI